MAKKKYIGELLVEEGIITSENLKEALEFQKTKAQNKQIGDILIELGFLTEDHLIEALEFQLGIPFADLDRTVISQDMSALVPDVLARKHHIVPVKSLGDKIHVAMADPFDLQAIDDIQTVSKKSVVPLFAKQQSIAHAIDDLYGNIHAEKAIEDFKKENNLQDAASELQEAEEEEVGNAPIVRLVNSILKQAVNDGASDIHIEPMENELRIRMRVDGALSKVLSIPKRAHAAVLTRIKIVGNLNIAERRIPQDGRCELDIMGHNVDVRISTLPTTFGEKAVLRLLDRESFLMPKSELGFTPENSEKFDLLLKNPYGILLVTGPTGSGKSTTLYTMLSELNKEKDNIITVEDPVEYMMHGLNQVNVNPKAGLDFANALRAILRQDPDKIMIGEIRDRETVQIAVRAAVTGHLVLSTLHTNSAPATISRLLDMQVEPYMLSAALVGVIAQRLVRKICKVCKKEHTPHAEDLNALGIEPGDITFRYFKGSGCQNCANTGYKGRMAVHEVLVVDSKIRNLIPENDASSKIKEYAKVNAISTIKDECVRLVKEGIISVDEAIAVAFTQD